jgi:hypothetical protein
MTAASASDEAFRVHLTNVVGTGAVQLVASLLPALERSQGHRLEQIYLPDRGELAGYRRVTPGSIHRQRRLFANAVSRVLECLWPGRQFDGVAPLLVMGDLPLRCRGPQAVFVQTLHLTKGARTGSRLVDVKYRVARAVFRANQYRPHAYIVQTDAMKAALARTFPGIADKVHVVRQPVPAWLLDAGLRRTARRTAPDAPLDLFYPAAPYPHKNHRLLRHASADPQAWPVGRLTLTIPPDAHPAPGVPWIRCVGLLEPPEVVACYRAADAVLFLSVAESYGLPLVEAMWIGLPIVCPDLPYAHALCGDEALYFQPDDAASLRDALQRLQARLRDGWWPDWRARLATIPRTWDVVAQAMLAVLFDVPAPPPASSR